MISVLRVVKVTSGRGVLVSYLRIRMIIFCWKGVTFRGDIGT